MNKTIEFYALSDKEKQWFIISGDYVRGLNHEITDDAYEAMRFNSEKEAKNYIKEHNVISKYQTVSKVNIGISIE